MVATPTSKKTRRFSLIRLFSSSNNNNNSSNHSSPSDMENSFYRHSMEPSTVSIDSMKTEMMHERRKSIATLTDNSFRTMGFDLRPSSIRPIRPIRNSRKETQPQAEMTEKMRQFDELLHTRETSTIRLTLTPSLLQG
ncbi:hypothetical protein BGZ49_006841, partial [Haplosporangium sp. Z 27]